MVEAGFAGALSLDRPRPSSTVFDRRARRRRVL